MSVHVIFVAPFFMTTTLRFIGGAARLPGVNLSVISQDRSDKIPARIRKDLAAHWQVDNALDARQLVQATQKLSAKLGTPHRMIGALEQLQVPLAQAREALGVAGLSSESARNFRDKSRMKQVLSAAGMPCARHVLAESTGQALMFAESVGFPIIAKPPAGAGGKGTIRLDNLADLNNMLRRYTPSANDPSLLEEFVSGTEHSFDSIVVKGKPAWHSISRYMPSPLEVMENSWIQWCVFLPRNINQPQFATISEVGYQAVLELGLQTGLSHMEWFQLRDDRIAISEVGARPPGAQITSLLSWAHELDFYHAWPKLMIFDQFEPPSRQYSVGAAYLRGQGGKTGSRRVRAIHGLEQAQQQFGRLVVESQLPSSGQHASDSYEGDGYVIIRHPDSEVVNDALQKIVSMVRVELE